MKLFILSNPLEDSVQENVCDLLLPFVNTNLSEKERIQRYGIRAISYTLVDDIAEADLCVLPRRWNDYVDKEKVDLAAKGAKRAAEAGKRLLIFSSGDYTANVPFDNAIIVERSAYKSRHGQRGQTILAEPALIDDYVRRYCDGNLRLREKSEKPVIGFCGQAGGSRFDFFRRKMMHIYRRITYRLGLQKWEPAPFEHTIFRKQVLDAFAGREEVSTNFLIRNRYRAGYLAAKKDPYHATRVEFIQNILDSDYTVCMRGAGNYSVRFYETLCLGRIPILVNTDCVLPFEDEIDYRKYCVWVEQNEISEIVEKTATFHNQLTSEAFRQLQRDCRALWLRYFSVNGYYGHFPRQISGQASYGQS